MTLAMVSFSYTVAQEETGSTSQPYVSGDNVFIFNQGDIAITIHLRPWEGEWTTYTMEPGSDWTFSCDNCTDFEITISTDGSETVNYRLAETKRFGIYWNSSGGYWDVYQASE
jgi:hypothetical protein